LIESFEESLNDLALGLDMFHTCFGIENKPCSSEKKLINLWQTQNCHTVDALAELAESESPSIMASTS
jgi:hypothetical protein